MRWAAIIFLLIIVIALLGIDLAKRIHVQTVSMSVVASATPGAVPVPTRRPVAHATSRPATEPSYSVIGIEGEIGTDVTADNVGKLVGAALVSHPDYLLIYFDSEGGHTDEVQPIIDALKPARQQCTIIADIHCAHSAAAIIALSCPRIFVESGGSIGGAVPFVEMPDGTPGDVGDKFRAAWKAECRAAAILGGHSPLLAEAMVDNEMELMMDANKRIYISDGTTPGVVIKSRRDVLMLDSAEAMRCGLSDGTCDHLGMIGYMLGFKRWKMKNWLARRGISVEDLYWAEAKPTPSPIDGHTP